ncbi:uncharacterized protein LOC128985428 isoform X2 [Macrosteles quadrilineatus]|nr:uncharacterized protein LOC128985428 isoform X2 [Macrosteles quadrilineatus]
MGFTIPQLTTCCCGCSLRTGTKIIGWLSLICGILMVILMGTSLTALYYLEDHPEKTPSPESKEILDHLPALKALAMFLIVVHILTCGLAFILLLGAYQNKAKFVLIWVVVSLTAEIMEQALNLAQTLTVSQGGIFYFNFIYFVIDLYFILVVYSFYREIKNVSTYP